MRKLGIFLCCQSLLSVSVIIAISKLTQCVDEMQGNFYDSAYRYIDMIQWVVVIIPFLVGVVLIKSKD